MSRSEAGKSVSGAAEWATTFGCTSPRCTVLFTTVRSDAVAWARPATTAGPCWLALATLLTSPLDDGVAAPTSTCGGADRTDSAVTESRSSAIEGSVEMIPDCGDSNRDATRGAI